jgi:hypothetical protein
MQNAPADKEVTMVNEATSDCLDNPNADTSPHSNSQAQRRLAPALRLILVCAENAEDLNEPGLATLSSYLDCVISHADQLVLPLHGGPVPAAAETLAARSSVHQALQRILDRGRRDGTIRADAMTRDLIALTALLAHSPGPGQTPRRLKAFFLDGLAPPAR